MHSSVEECLSCLEKEAPGVPLLALGQTVFWDEPLKIAVILSSQKLGKKNKLIAGIHDTDYFAKLPGGVVSNSPFVALPKNDHSTKGFWSAAAEFSALFGGETPVTRETYAETGVSLERLSQGEAEFLDEKTEAWGWRGIAQSDPMPKVAGEIELIPLFGVLQKTYNWAIDLTLQTLCEPKQNHEAKKIADHINEILCETLNICEGQTLSGFYECLLPHFHKMLSDKLNDVEITSTTKLLNFNPTTCNLPRFDFVNLFLNSNTKNLAKKLYNESVSDTEIYDLDKFGTGAIPFDLVIPGIGRGTIRLTDEMLIIMTHEPKFVKLNKPIQNTNDLSDVVSKSFGDCCLIGKAVTLINMLSREFIFVFHETASPYVSVTKKLNNLFEKNNIRIQAHPILRIAHETWDALSESDRWFRLPEPFQKPFGAEHVSAQTIAKTWRCVVEQQKDIRKKLKDIRKMHDLIAFLQKSMGGRWQSLATEYEKLSEDLNPLKTVYQETKNAVNKYFSRLREIKKLLPNIEKQMGEHFRKEIFRRNPVLESALEKRKVFQRQVQELKNERINLRKKLFELRENQRKLASQKMIVDARKRRTEIEKEAEYARLQIVRESVISSSGLERANRRPSAWWMMLVSPDGQWFQSMMEKMQFRLEDLKAGE